MAYWRNDSFYAFGLGATSHLHGTRVQRPRKYKEYETWVATRGWEMQEGNSTAGASDLVQEEEALLDFVMLSLRLSSGLLLAGLNEKYGNLCEGDAEGRIMEAVKDHVVEGLVLVSEKGERIRLSDPEGFLLSNTIISDIFSSL